MDIIMKEAKNIGVYGYEKEKEKNN